MKPQERPSKEQAVKELKNAHHKIRKDDANQMIKAYQKWRDKHAGQGAQPGASDPDFPISLAFNKNEVLEILNHPDAFGLRIFPAINSKNEMTVVLVAFDEELQNITHIYHNGQNRMTSTGTSQEEGGLDESQTCPPYPTPTQL